MPDQRGDRDLGETDIIGDAGEAVPQDMRRHVGQRTVPENLSPVVGEAAEGVVLALAGEDRPSLQISSCRHGRVS